MAQSAPVGLSGRITVATFDGEKYPTPESVMRAMRGEDWDQIQSSKNLIVTTGINAIIRALNWALIQNDNANWNTPYLAASGNLGEVWGAVGTGSSTPVATQTILDTESARAQIYLSSISTNMLILNAFLSTAQANVAITEAGWFAQATSAANSGTLLDRAKLATAVNKSNTNTAIVQLQLTVTSA